MAPRSLTNYYPEAPSMFEDFFRPWNELIERGSNRSMITLPAVNISENKENFQISLAAPGMKKEDFRVEVDGNMLTISSEKEETKEQKEEKYSRKEYNYASFTRSFALPDLVEREKIDARYNNGILEIKLPKKEDGKQSAAMKQITVK